MTPPGPGGRRVVVVTGGGGGIGAAIAAELGRRGDFVVTVDPLVSLDGSEPLPAPEQTTAGRIVAAGGAARASSASVTDRDAIAGLFAELLDEHGRLDAVVNVAGITRPTGFARGREQDWQAVLAVHLDGYRNVLDAALPIMAAAGRGHVLGVTSGSGWRAADAGAYSCAKRAVAALTWQLGAVAPPGVVVNAISPIAVTRMVTAALARAGAAPRSSGGSKAAAATGGLSLGAMPEPDDLGPLAAHLVAEGFDRCRGQVVFAGGSEVALVEPPRLLESVAAVDPARLPRLLDAVVPGAFVPAEAGQTSGGGANPRFASAFAGEGGSGPASVPAVRRCAVVADRPEAATAITRALEARGVSCTGIDAGGAAGFDAATAALAAVDGAEPLDAVFVALAGGPPGDAVPAGWQRVLAEHAGVAERIHADAGWARAVVDLAAAVARPIRLVTLVDATTAGGRSRAQAAAQLARASRRATDDRVAAVSVAVEGNGGDDPAAALVAHLVAGSSTADLVGAELVVGGGWIGLRSHPRPTAGIVLDGPAIPDWFDNVLGEACGGPALPGARPEGDR